MKTMNTPAQIWRKALIRASRVRAPRNVTFAHQPAREQFSLWFNTLEQQDCEYLIVPTGEDIPPGGELAATAVASDGFEVAHLIRFSASPESSVVKTNP